MKILIPMSGIGKRFREKGYKNPKYLLEIFEKPILDHILKLFPNEDDLHLILNKEDYENSDIINKIKEIIGPKNITIQHITKHKKGPGHALLVSGLLDTEDDVFINYCDFSNIWDWEKVKKYINTHQPDGLLPAYKGIHLHTIYGSKYAFIKEKNGKVEGVKEKEPFTDNPQNEYASTGGYYFSSGNKAKKYIENLFMSESLINGEAYISSAYDLMVKDGLDVQVYGIDHFFQWGTPEDYEEFKYCMAEYKTIISGSQLDLMNMNLVLPIAGKGQRFKDEGYVTPKVLLDLNNKPMIEQILNKFSNYSAAYILSSQEIESEIIEIFKKNKKINVSSTPAITKGQAESALILIEKINNEHPIFVQSGDSILGHTDLQNLLSSEIDMAVFTKKNYRRAFTNANNFGWVASENDLITETKIKESPGSKNYSMILGSFWFKNSLIYKTLYNDIANGKYKELHIDHMIDAALRRDMQVLEVNIPDTAVIGTPLEYELSKYSEIVYRSFDES